MMTTYNIDWRKWIAEVLNPKRSKPKRIALLLALVKRIRDVHSEFVDTHASNKEKLSWNGQKILLQRYLQLKFGAGILIENAGSTGTVLIAYEAPMISNPITYDAPVFTNPIAGEAGEGVIGANFIVKVPSSITFNENQMRAIIDRYLINYKSYIIQIV